ncbi:hypothetical protein BSKO_09202 [Bryopsis sp. KO-2023]|nr:hypothetical protein BSKO_09202 [Bryopsis sp. KO-2023]
MSFVATTSQIPVRAVRPIVSRPAVSARIVRPSARVVKLWAEPNSVEQAIEDAKETCKDSDNTQECANAWDTVEELSANASHKKEAAEVSKKDPLDEYCEEVPDADECRVYED